MKKMKTSEGTTRANPPAKRYGNGELFSDVSTCAGSVRCETVRIVAANTSFQDSTKVKMDAAAIPGRARGSDTRRNAPSGVQPSVSAASSSSRGTLKKTLPVIKTVVGKAKAVWTSDTPASVSYNPQSIKVTARGIDRITIGKERVARIMSWNVWCPRNP